MATTLAGQQLEEATQKILLLTEPYTVQSSMPYMPRRAKVVLGGGDRNILTPRAAIAASPDISINALES